jgi:hypothetical protein
MTGVDQTDCHASDFKQAGWKFLYGGTERAAQPSKIGSEHEEDNLCDEACVSG